MTYDNLGVFFILQVLDWFYNEVLFFSSNVKQY